MLCCFGSGQPKKGEEPNRQELVYEFPTKDKQPDGIGGPTAAKVVMSQPGPAVKAVPEVERKPEEPTQVSLTSASEADSKAQPSAVVGLETDDSKLRPPEITLAKLDEVLASESDSLSESSEAMQDEKTPLISDTLPSTGREEAAEMAVKKQLSVDEPRPSAAGELVEVVATESQLPMADSEKERVSTIGENVLEIAEIKQIENGEVSFEMVETTEELVVALPVVMSIPEGDGDPPEGGGMAVTRNKDSSSDVQEHRMLVGKNRSFRIYRQSVSEEVLEETWCVVEPLVTLESEMVRITSVTDERGGELLPSPGEETTVAAGGETPLVFGEQELRRASEETKKLRGVPVDEDYLPCKGTIAQNPKGRETSKETEERQCEVSAEDPTLCGASQTQRIHMSSVDGARETPSGVSPPPEALEDTKETCRTSLLVPTKERISRARSCPLEPRRIRGNPKRNSRGRVIQVAFEDSSEDEDDEVEGSSEKKWARSNSLRRPFHRARDNNNSHGHHHHHHQDPAAHSDTEIGKISAPHSLLDGERGSGGGSVTSERAIDVGRVAAWAASFEKLLEDPAGLHTFAEFLKKEYSHENIYFWTACERYKRLSSPDELQAMAKVIFERHLCIGASEPVNVDSQARQDAQDSLHNPNEFLFSQAQKQIFNLMKFDSYSRFLKSNLYQDCLASDMRGQTLPYPGDETMDPDLKIIQDDSHVALKKSKSDADERRRKSLLPWHRKDRSKSKDRGEAEYRRQKKMGHRNQSDSSSVRSDMSGSRTSLNSSSDLALGRRAVSKESLTSGELGSLSGSEGYHRCRVILPDLSNSVVAVRHGETIQELLTRLLERRGISYSTFEVYQNKTDKLIDKNDDSVILGGLEVRIERRVLFRLDLPNRKTVCIKARPNKLTSEVLKPILHKYSYKLDLMSIHKVGEEKSINLKAPITEIDGDRLVVQTKEEVKEWGIEPARQKKKRGNGNTLDEITNRVFEDLLKGKSEQNFDELGILDFDARSSRTEHSSDQSSSGVTGGFGIRNSAPTEKDMNKSRKPPNRASVHDSLGVRGMPPPDHALISKRRGMGSNTPNPNDELYEGLKRAQRSRLDDQRGTEINFELPDFLKCDDDQPEDKENQRTHLTDQLLAQLECSFSDGSVIPTHREAEDYFSIAHPEVWGGIPTGTSGGPHSANATLMAPDLDLDDFDDTLVAGEDSLGKVGLPLPPDTPSCPALHMDPPNFSPPPPLPPKPKLGGTRGPPPRPPSRQLHPFNPPTFSSTSDEDGLHHSSDPPIHLGRQSISFV